MILAPRLRAEDRTVTQSARRRHPVLAPIERQRLDPSNPFLPERPPAMKPADVVKFYSVLRAANPAPRSEL